MSFVVTTHSAGNRPRVPTSPRLRRAPSPLRRTDAGHAESEVHRRPRRPRTSRPRPAHHRPTPTTRDGPTNRAARLAWRPAASRARRGTPRQPPDPSPSPTAPACPPVLPPIETWSNTVLSSAIVSDSAEKAVDGPSDKRRSGAPVPVPVEDGLAERPVAGCACGRPRASVVRDSGADPILGWVPGAFDSSLCVIASD